MGYADFSGTDTLINPCPDFSECKNLKNIDSLKRFKSISSINFRGCESLEALGDLERLEGLSSFDLTGCVSLTDVSGIAELKNLRELKLAGCLGVKVLPRSVNMKLKNEVEKYQVRLFKAAGKPFPEYLKRSIQERKEREVGIYDTFTKIKKLFRQGSFVHDKQGLELARSSGDPALFDCLLEGISYTHIDNLEKIAHEIRGVYYIPVSNDLKIKVGKIDGNKVFKGTKADYASFVQAFLGLIAYAPPGCKTAEQLKNEIKSLSVILPEGPDEAYIDMLGTSLLDWFKYLEALELINCRSLKDLNGLSGLKRLKYLWFRDCGQLKRLEGLNDLPALEEIDLSAAFLLRILMDFGKGNITIFIPFAVMNMNKHSIWIDIAHLQMCTFLKPESQWINKARSILDVKNIAPFTRFRVFEEDIQGCDNIVFNNMNEDIIMAHQTVWKASLTTA